MKKESKEINEIRKKMDIDGHLSLINRARGITVGSSFCGTIELTLRGNGDKFLYAQMQPVEAIEIIHQLAAACGCHIAIKPRDDFSSWRNWRVTEEEKNKLNGHPPFPNDLSEHVQVGATLPEPNKQPGVKFDKESEYEPTVATQKTVNRRGAKRASKTS